MSGLPLSQPHPIRLRLRGGTPRTPNPLPAHSAAAQGGTVGSAAARPSGQSLDALEGEVHAMPILVQQYAAGALQRMSRMQSVPLGQGGVQLKDEAPTHLSDEPFAEADRLSFGQQSFGNLPHNLHHAPPFLHPTMQSPMAPQQQQLPLHGILPGQSPPGQQPFGQLPFGHQPFGNPFLAQQQQQHFFNSSPGQPFTGHHDAVHTPPMQQQQLHPLPAIPSCYGLPPLSTSPSPFFSQCGSCYSAAASAHFQASPSPSVAPMAANPHLNHIYADMASGVASGGHGGSAKKQRRSGNDDPVMRATRGAWNDPTIRTVDQILSNLPDLVRHHHRLTATLS